MVVAFGRWGRRDRPGLPRTATSADLAHLETFANARPGCEAFLEPRTTVTEPTLLLVAPSGEWTRRRVAGTDAAVRFPKRLGLPHSDPDKVGYPQRMRDYTARRREADRSA